MKYRNKVLAVLLVAVLTAVPLAACSKKAAPASAGDTPSGGRGNASSQTQIVGKVTSVIGNQVVLEVGTLKNGGGFGGRSESSGSANGSSGRAGGSVKSGMSSQTETASSGGQGSGSSGSSSGSITLTGETKTVLIPVGLTLTSGGTSARRSAGSAGSQAGSQSGSGSAGGSAGRSFGGTSGTSGGSTGGSFGGFGGTSGGTSRSGGSGNSGGRSGVSAGGTSAGTAGSTLATLQRSQDFSSIKKGMVLQIVEGTLSDGTQGITQVRIISQ